MKPRDFSLIIVALLSSLVSMGQNSFMKGYFIKNDSTRTECLIKDIDWKNNPSEFKYKTEESEEIKTADIESVNEFGIYQKCRYIRSNVQIDYSSNNVEELTSTRSPEWSDETLFLKVLIEGKATLYSYESRNLFRLFYSVDNNPIKQLICKDYRQNYTIYSNNDFRQQLWTEVHCDEKLSHVKNLQFSKKNIEKYFLNYNECVGNPIIQHEIKAGQNLFNLKISAGMDISDLSVMFIQSQSRNTTLGKEISPNISMEFECILPFHNNKWGIILRPTFQSFSYEEEYEDNISTVEYKPIQFPIGIRHYFFLNQNLKIYINGFYVPDLAINIKPEMDIYQSYYKYNKQFDISPVHHFAAGAGIEYNKISFEVLAHSNNDILHKYMNYWADFSTITFSVGYKILNK